MCILIGVGQTSRSIVYARSTLHAGKGRMTEDINILQYLHHQVKSRDHRILSENTTSP